MPEYRRCYVPGGTYFFTLVTYGRRPLFDDVARVEALRGCLRQVRKEWPFEVVAGVVLPDHMHFIWTLPIGDVGYSKRIGRLKALFTKAIGGTEGATGSRVRHRESGVWQRRFWEHTIRDERDLEHHLHYVHYNPVKHGYTACPHAWPHSSFGRWVDRAMYGREWCCACGSGVVKVPYPEELSASVGE